MPRQLVLVAIIHCHQHKQEILPYFLAKAANERRHTNGQETDEKKISNIRHEGNANQTHSETALHTL